MYIIILQNPTGILKPEGNNVYDAQWGVVDLNVLTLGSHLYCTSEINKAESEKKISRL